MQNLVAEVINPSGHTVNIESRGCLSVVVKSAFEVSGPQHFPVRDKAQFERLRDQLHRALPFCSGLSVTLRDLSEQPKAAPAAPALISPRLPNPRNPPARATNPRRKYQPLRSKE